MKEELYHVVIEKSNGSFVSRYALAILEDHIIFKKAAGVNLPAEYFRQVIKALRPNFITECDNLHKSRTYPWRIRFREGRSGCLDLWIESLIDPEFKLINRSRRFRISMNNKLDGLFVIHMRDIPPLLQSDKIPSNDDEIHIKVIDMEDYFIDDFSH